MLFWNKSKINKKRINQVNLDDAQLVEQEDTVEQLATVSSGNDFANYVPVPILEYAKSCEYPLNIKHQFPYWTQIKPTGYTGPILSELVEEYYKWLTCGTKQNITPLFGFFELENIKKIETLPDDLFLLHAKMYIPSLPEDALQNDVSIEELKTLLRAIHKKLYSIKGSEYSFKYLISLLFNITPDDIYTVYPKKYLMVLNQGLNSNVAGSKPQPSYGRLNYSIIPDSTIWNEYSYIVNLRNSGDSISRERLEKLIKPILHPVGLKGFYQESKVLFSSIREIVTTAIWETPKIQNYFYFTLFSTEANSPDSCFGCTLSPNAPTYKFPSWSLKISDPTFYPAGVSFGSINIKDFWDLYPSVEGVFPNSTVNCTGC